jgi:hypothetical protein
VRYVVEERLNLGRRAAQRDLGAERSADRVEEAEMRVDDVLRRLRRDVDDSGEFDPDDSGEPDPDGCPDCPDGEWPYCVDNFYADQGDV